MNQAGTDEITAYVEGVRAALSGLPESTRDELLEDLPEHLAEVAADGIGTLHERLGPPSVYAAELLASAGYVGGFPDPPPSTDRFGDLAATVRSRLDLIDVRTGPAFGSERASTFLVQLRPAWWVLRGYLVAMVLAMMFDTGSQPLGLLPRIGGSELLALVLLGGCVWASIWFGRRAPRLAKGPRVLVRLGTIGLVLVALAGFASADGSSRDSFYTETSYSDPYSHVQDVFVYDSQGRLIEGARLFDQDGQPIRLGSPYCYDPNQEFSDAREVTEMTYPYCTENAPFNLPGPTEEAVPAPSEPVPSPSK